MSDRIRSLISILRTPELIVDGRKAALGLLEDVEQDRIETARSWSPFGFIVIDVAPWNEDAFLRLHIWPTTRPATTGPDWRVHPHSLHLKSWVLAGAITNETYDVVKSDDSSEFVLYQASCLGGESLLEQTASSVRFSMVQACTYGAGETYYVPKGEYHSTRVEAGSLTATLCLMWDRAPEKSLIVGEAHPEPVLRFRRPSPTDDEVHPLVTALRKLMTRELAGDGRSMTA